MIRNSPSAKIIIIIYAIIIKYYSSIFFRSQNENYLYLRMLHFCARAHARANKPKGETVKKKWFIDVPFPVAGQSREGNCDIGKEL